MPWARPDLVSYIGGGGLRVGRWPPSQPLTGAGADRLRAPSCRPRRLVGLSKNLELGRFESCRPERQHRLDAVLLILASVLNKGYLFPGERKKRVSVLVRARAGKGT